MTEPMQALPASIKRSKTIVLASVYGLIFYFLAATIAVTGTLNLATPFIWLLQSLPLFLFLPGLHASRLRSYGWVSFLVLLYFTHAVMVAFDPARRVLGVIEVLLCCALFAAIIVFIRQFKAHYQVPI
jgi:uncharacterized membrane protein